MTIDPFSNNPYANEILLEYADFPKEFTEEFRIRLIQLINEMCIAINSKESSFYSNEISITSAKVLPIYRKDLEGDKNISYRTVRRKVILTGPLPNANVKTIPHEIVFPKGSVAWKLWGMASRINNENLMGFQPLPFSSGIPSNCIELRGDLNNIYITSFNDKSPLNFSFVVVEYAVLLENI